MKAVGCTGQMHNHLVWHRYVRALRKEGKTSYRKAFGNQPTNQPTRFLPMVFVLHVLMKKINNHRINV